MSITINHVNGDILYTSETGTTLCRVVIEAVARGANLQGAYLRGAYLRDANLQGADLQGASLHGADLQCAYLRDADLRDVSLRNANLRDANLQGADLRGAYLRDANLRNANLRDANLRGADLQGVDLRDVDLRDADLRDAENAELAIAQTVIAPPATKLRGWKQCRNGVIVELEVPPEAKRSNATGRKCRAEYAKVIAVHGADEGVSWHDPRFVYRTGEIVRPAIPFDEDRWNECGSGIHFYLTREEAEAHG